MARQIGKSNKYNDELGRTHGKSYPYTVEEYEQITDWVKKNDPAYYKSMAKTLIGTDSAKAIKAAIDSNDLYEWWIGSIYVMHEPFNQMMKLMLGKPVDRDKLNSDIEQWNWQMEKKYGKGRKQIDLQKYGLA